MGRFCGMIVRIIPQQAQVVAHKRTDILSGLRYRELYDDSAVVMSCTVCCIIRNLVTSNVAVTCNPLQCDVLFAGRELLMYLNGLFCKLLATNTV